MMVVSDSDIMIPTAASVTNNPVNFFSPFKPLKLHCSALSFTYCDVTTSNSIIGKDLLIPIGEDRKKFFTEIFLTFVCNSSYQHADI